MDKNELKQLLQDQGNMSNLILTSELSDRETNQAIALWFGRGVDIALGLAELAAKATPTWIDDNVIRMARAAGLPSQIQALVLNLLEDDDG